MPSTKLGDSSLHSAANAVRNVSSNMPEYFKHESEPYYFLNSFRAVTRANSGLQYTNSELSYLEIPPDRRVVVDDHVRSEDNAGLQPTETRRICAKTTNYIINYVSSNIFILGNHN